MSNCTSGCKTKDHQTFADCLRSKNAGAVGVNISKGSDADTQRRWDSNLDSYRAARAEGLQPAGTMQHQIDAARAISDATGTAYKA